MCVPRHNCPPPPRHLTALSLSLLFLLLGRGTPLCQHPIRILHAAYDDQVDMHPRAIYRPPCRTLSYIPRSTFTLLVSSLSALYLYDLVVRFIVLVGRTTTPKKSDTACLCALCRRTTSAFASREVMRPIKKSPRRVLA